MKRGGNNHFGSTGILKCLQCRRRKGKVSLLLNNGVYTEADQDSVNTLIQTKPVGFAQTEKSNVEANTLQRVHMPTNSPSN